MDVSVEGQLRNHGPGNLLAQEDFLPENVHKKKLDMKDVLAFFEEVGLQLSFKISWSHD